MAKILVNATHGNEDADDTPIGNTVVINPEIEVLTEDRILRWEGCLRTIARSWRSLPGQSMSTARCASMRRLPRTRC